MTEPAAGARAAQRLYHAIRPLLAGVPADVAGAALADLTATWIAGHVVEGEPEATRAEWHRLLARQIGLTAVLIEVNARMVGSDLAAARREGSA